MNDIRSVLVELYSQAPVAEVHESARYRRVIEKYEADSLRQRVFYQERERVEWLRAKVDQHLNGLATHKKEVEMALRLIWRSRGSDLQESMIVMVVASYGRDWSGDQRTYFEAAARFFLAASPYFLSFTTRNRAHPQVNHINRHHEHFIRDALGSEAYDAADLSVENLVAEAVNYHLTSRRVGGFYFPRHIGDNREVQAKIDEALKRCLALVQLVQSESFRQYHGRPNWCRIEHDVVYGQYPDRVLFVEIDPGIDPDEVHIDCDDWFQHFTGRDKLKLAWTRWGIEIENVDENVRKLTNDLVAQIDEARDRIYHDIPAA